MECTFTKNIPCLQNNDIHLWVFHSSSNVPRLKLLENVLSNDEIERANRYRFREDYDQFILSRGCLRFVLGRYLEIKPTQIRFSYNAYGKPILANELNQRGLSFNQSHTFGLGLLAITQEHSIGVDIEYIRDDFPFEDIARKNFTIREVSELEKTSHSTKKETFFNCWTRKEAFLKALGGGLSIPLDSFDVSLSAKEGTLMLTTHPDPNEGLNWTLQHLNICKGYSAALAIQCPINNIYFFDCQDYF